jgi:hypothetical protein
LRAFKSAAANPPERGGAGTEPSLLSGKTYFCVGIRLEKHMREASFYYPERIFPLFRGKTAIPMKP